PSARITPTRKCRAIANSFTQAEETGYNVTAALISFLTFTCDVGIEIAGCDIVEKATGSSKAIYGMLGKIKPLSLPRDYDEFLSDEKNRRLLAAYREGMNATNVFYQALTFAKVIEGMTKTIPRPDNSGAIDSRRRYMSTRIPAELSDLPVTSNEIVETFRPFLGKKFSWVR
ncbi:MAG: hypothetical protein DME32_07030, partial [Verrucomicrobia bacterium]